MTRPDSPSAQPLIEAYGDGGFRIGGVRHQGSVALGEGGASPWPVARAEEITAEALERALAGSPGAKVLVVGTGVRTVPLSGPLRVAFESRGIGLEAMGTGAASRTYNVLLAEGRRVAAALIAVP